MKKILIFAGTLSLLFFTASKLKAQNKDLIRPSDIKQKRTVYFTPEVYPNIEEIKQPTNWAFFSAVSDKIKDENNNRMIRVDFPTNYDSIDPKTIEEYCKNNDAEFAVVPKVKFFKVGIGKFVFSNQVVVSMKLYDAEGKFITETSYDTYKKDGKMLGSAENSIKAGTDGALKNLLKNIRKMKGKVVDIF